MTNAARVAMLLGAGLLAGQSTFAAAPPTSPRLPEPVISQSVASIMEKQVRRELITLPWLSIFDSLSFRVDGETVTLLGKVRVPTLRSDAENVVKRLEGVEKVVNQIEVLPLSPQDERLRLALYNTIYGHVALEPLSIRALPPIHIIVENGHVTLEGSVGTEMQKNIAGIQARTVSGSFSVTNNLRVETN